MQDWEKDFWKNGSVITELLYCPGKASLSAFQVSGGASFPSDGFLEDDLLNIVNANRNTLS